MIRDCDGLATFEACFHHATHVVIAPFLVAVLITQVDLHSRDLIAESAEGVLDNLIDLSGERIATISGDINQLCLAQQLISAVLA